MTIDQTEWLVIIMIIGLYLYDSSLLLFSNEGIISPSGKNAWLIRFGSKFYIKGKELFIPNPFVPHKPIFRLAWACPSGTSNSEYEWAKLYPQLMPLVPMIYAMALTLFVFIPVGITMKVDDHVLLITLVFFYLNLVISLIWVGVYKQVLGISTGRFIGMAFECVVCPPFAVNLIRRISAGININDDLIVVARALQSEKAWEITRQNLLARINEEIEAEEDNSDRANALKHCRQQLID